MNNLTIHKQKKNKRQIIHNKRKERLQSGSLSTDRIREYIEYFNWPKDSIIALYYPLKGEVDLRFLHENYSHIVYPNQEERFVFAKKDSSFVFQSSFYQPVSDKEKACPIQDIDVFFVPGLAFDRRGVRLGRGRGFYDKVLSQSREGLKIGAAWSFQVETENLPQEKTDICMDVLMTENFMLFPSKKERI